MNKALSQKIFISSQVSKSDSNIDCTFPKKVAFFSFIGDVGAEIVFDEGAGA
jgi:hypothetical protein